MFDRIPTDDPQEALAFTRALSEFLQPSSSAVDSPVPEISIVIPIFNERAGLPALFDRLFTTLAGEDFEVICVDDGSRDGSVRYLQGLANQDARVVLFTKQNNARDQEVEVGRAEAARKANVGARIVAGADQIAVRRVTDVVAE